jgi:Heterokaryon incompatibility protein (HET)
MKTLDALKSSIPISSMSQTFVDAVKVTRRIGLQYLWIDSLCIIQDSVQDWQQESSKMCAVYSNAVVNVTATSSRDGDESFLHPRLTAIQLPRRNDAQESLNGRTLSKAIWLRPILPDINRLIGRAWCFQEVILAPRSLNFGYHEVHYRCRVSQRTETAPNLTT